MNKTIRIALIGNPNTGKSTLFNSLTGLRQRVGNYPGITVERKEGDIKLPNGEKAVLVDLPGTYSLATNSKDEEVVIDLLAGSQNFGLAPDAIICVLDATNLQRNLFLATQLADLKTPTLIVLNQWDLVEKLEIKIDKEELSKRLGVPVISTVATRNDGITLIKEAIPLLLEEKPLIKAVDWPNAISESTQILKERLEKSGATEIKDIILKRILFDAQSTLGDHFSWSESEKKEALEAARKPIFQAGFNPLSVEPVLTYKFLNELLNGVLTTPQQRIKRLSEKVDSILTHRVWGMMIFIGLMLIVFQAVYAWSGPLMDLIDAGTGYFQDLASGWLSATPTLQSLVCDGIIAGVGGVLIFLPQILVLFLFIGILEDTGYMARAAYLMDRVFGWCGLNGKSFVPLLSSFACAVPGVMAARTIEDPKARLSTILIAPLMSCSARLPVYVLMIGAFIEPKYGSTVASFVLFGMHVLGLALALPIALFINKFLMKTKPQHFLLEMSPYKLPQVKHLFWRMFLRGKEFVVRAGTIILAISIIIWALLYYPRPKELEQEVQATFKTSYPELAADADLEELPKYQAVLDSAYIEQSFMGKMGKGIQPLFSAAGFDWKITVGILSSFPAREVIISTIGIIYQLGGDVDEESDDLKQTMISQLWTSGEKQGQPIYTLPVVFAIMVFFALCMQCGATVAVIIRESHWKWGLFTFVYMTSLAWVGAVLTYQIGNLFL
jgi:ferrous iron transport protein B